MKIKAIYQSYLQDKTPAPVRKVRYEPKDFRHQVQIDGEWVCGKVDETLELMPYGWHWCEPGRVPLLIVEGEKDADNLHEKIPEANILSDKSIGSTRTLKKAVALLRPKKVYIIGDNDAAGRQIVDRVACALYNTFKGFMTIRTWTPSEKGWDLTDFMEHGGDLRDIATGSKIAEFAPVARVLFAPSGDALSKYLARQSPLTEPGNRNRGMSRMAWWMKNHGFGMEESLAAFLAWDQCNLPQSEIRACFSNTWKK